MRQELTADAEFHVERAVTGSLTKVLGGVELRRNSRAINTNSIVQRAIVKRPKGPLRARTA